MTYYRIAKRKKEEYCILFEGNKLECKTWLLCNGYECFVSELDFDATILRLHLFTDIIIINLGNENEQVENGM